ncbi:phage tail domain-containing protein [Clostridium sp. HBUAS56017]|uniref:phage distal tail protein n=1 Tax=Clostridium sp. HBUAS56017 TaxID=2571128 RepID=UPI001178B202|nr:phage tail domain-containing protein [Clostridium sp. HBUAS56017]
MRIDIINKRIGNSITLDSYVLISGVLITKFYQGTIPTTFNKIKGINQYGSTLLSTTLEEREINIEAVILADNRMEIEAIKNNIDATLNPLDTLLLKYTNDNVSKEIECSVSATPLYSTSYETNNNMCLGFKVDFECFNPFWKDQEETILNVETWEGGFEFEFELPSNGIEFARKGPNEIEIINYGNVSAPLEVYFNGPALNPTIKLGKKFIKVNRVLAEDEILYINTSFSNKAVEVMKGNTRERAYHYIDIDSNFFDLETGSNILSYATDGDYLPQSVIIKYKCHYFSL